MIRIDGSRLLRDLHKLRRFGAVNYNEKSFGGDGLPKGVSRVSLSREDVESRKWFAEKCAEAGLSPRIDPLGTMVARRPGTKKKRLLCGSHSDSQPEGGWLDGAMGCAFALEASRALEEAEGVDKSCCIDVVNFADEEGRFGTLTGSRVFCGSDVEWDAVSLSPERVAPRSTLREASKEAEPGLRASGYYVEEPLKIEKENLVGFFEAHIEQGRRLERADSSVGSVTSIVGLRQLRITVHGEQNHAGATLMPDRKDAGRALVRLCTVIDETFGELVTSNSGVAPNLVWTFSVFDVRPGAPSAIPGYAHCVLQIRDSDNDVLEAAEAAVRHLANSAFLPAVVTYDRPKQNPVPLDPHLLTHVEAAAQTHCGDGQLTLHSGAIHDAASVALLAKLPAAMLFVPSIGGISHAFDEDTDERHILKGAQVYTDAAARMLGIDARVELVA